MGGTILGQELHAVPEFTDQAPEYAHGVLATNFIAKAIVPVGLAASDVVFIVCATLTAIVLRATLFPSLLGIDAFNPVRNYLSLWPAAALLIFLRAALGLYPGYGIHPAEELKRQTMATFALALVVLGGSALFQFSEVYSRVILATTGIFLLVGLPILRSLLQAWLARTRIYGRWVWIIGKSRRANYLAQIMSKNPELGLRFAGMSSGPPESCRNIRHCLVVPEGLDDMPLAEMLDLLNERFDRVWLAPNLLDIASVWVIPRDLTGHLALELRNSLLETHSRVIKRLTDILLCLFALPLALPIMLFIAIWLRISDGGESFIRQERIGRGGQTFRILKFRTMHQDAEKMLSEVLKNDPKARDEWERTRKLRDDPRVTRLGRFLRRSSLDELPQLFNVLAGEMSLVGPRPVMPDEVARYGDTARLYLRVRPGVTGLTQVSGRSELTYDERVRLDTYYVRNWSVWIDFIILGRTFGQVLKGSGAY